MRNRSVRYSNPSLLPCSTAPVVGPDFRRMMGLMDGKGPDGSSSGVWIFGQPIRVIEAGHQEQLEVAGGEIDEASRSCHAIVLADYEVGSWFEPKLKIVAEEHPWAPFQAWLFDETTWLQDQAFAKWLSQCLEETGSAQRPSGIVEIRAEVGWSDYSAAVESALRQIACGGVYQVNLTWRIYFTFFGASLPLYRTFRRTHHANYITAPSLP